MSSTMVLEAGLRQMDEISANPQRGSLQITGDLNDKHPRLTGQTEAGAVA
jgi:hypothetical protein